MEDFKRQDGNQIHQQFKGAGLVVEKKVAANGTDLVSLPMLSKEGWSLFQSFMQDDMVNENGVNPSISTFKNYVSGTTITLAGATQPIYEIQASSAGEKLYVDPDLKQKIANDGSITEVKISCASLFAKLVATSGNAALVLAMDSINTATPNAKIFFDLTTVTAQSGDTSAVALFKSEDVSAEGTDSFEINQGEKYAITGLPTYVSASGVGTYTFKVKRLPS